MHALAPQFNNSAFEVLPISLFSPLFFLDKVLIKCIKDEQNGINLIFRRSNILTFK